MQPIHRGEHMLALQMVIYGYASLILLFLVLDSRANKRMLPEKSKWFRVILYTTLWLIFSEAVTMFVDGRPGAAMYWVVYLSNSVLFLFNVLPLSLWLIYLDECRITSYNVCYTKLLRMDSSRKFPRRMYAPSRRDYCSMCAATTAPCSMRSRRAETSPTN